jgi:hypothetical protein
MERKQIKSFIFWLPAMFCALISLMALFMPNDTGKPAVFSFLPMCFFYAGSLFLSLNNRIKLLEAEVDELKAPPAGNSGADG